MRGKMAGLLLLAAGALSAAGFAPLGWWPVTLIGLIALFEMTRRAVSWRQALARGWLFGLGHFTVGLNWIAGAFQYQNAMPVWLGWVAVVVLSSYLALFPAAVAAVSWKMRRRDSAFLLAFAALWMLGEGLRATLFTGFAWNPLGVVAVDVGAAAAWIGTYGLSGLVVLTAGALWLVLFRRDWRGAAMAAALPVMALIVFFLTPEAPPRSDPPSLQIVQPNIGQQDKWREDYAEENFNRLAHLSGKPGKAPRLVFWPEAAVPDYLEDEITARERIAGLIGPRDLLLTGGVAIEWGANQTAVAARNSLFVVDGQGTIRGRYDKSHLVPFGEYLPMRPLLSAIGLSRLVQGDLDFWPGTGPQTLDLSGFGRMGVQICYEIIFSGHVIDPAHRPDFLFNPSNDAWFGSWGPPQHLSQARLRAMEEGIPVIRSTPTGISAVIDAHGRIVRALPYRAAAAIHVDLPPPLPPTLFARFGNSLAFAFAMFLLAGAIAISRRSR